MQPKLPDIIIWLKRKIHVNYGIVQARAMKSSQDSIIILPTMRTTDKSSQDSIIILPIMRTTDKSSREI